MSRLHWSVEIKRGKKIGLLMFMIYLVLNELCSIVFYLMFLSFLDKLFMNIAPVLVPGVCPDKAMDNKEGSLCA